MCLVVECVNRVAGLRKYRKCVLFAICILYLCGLVYYVGFRGHREGLSGVNIRFPLPFWRAIRSHRYGSVTKRSVLNMLLFVPFGYLLPQWKRLRWYQVVTLGLMLSLLIETGQLVFHFGVFELDDLVKNTMGAGVGFLLYLLGKNIISRIK